MGYQALLFCPDEKTARNVTNVLNDLDFTVEPCTEPFAAVKKLMAQHFDAVVVDCDNEQNATLLFKSARNSSSNQSSLAVAVVEGQAGVAKAFRIGANLVLTKPINVEQAKGTLRVARGLLRKTEAAKPAATAVAAPAVTKPAAPPASPRPAAAVAASGTPISRGVTPAIPPKPAAPASRQPVMSGDSAAQLANLVEPAAPVQKPAAPVAAKPAATQPVTTPVPKAEPKADKFVPAPAPPAIPSSTGAASAPARAREHKEPIPEAISVAPASDHLANLPEMDTAPGTDSTAAPTTEFTFGGNTGTPAAAGGNKK